MQTAYLGRRATGGAVVEKFCLLVLAIIWLSMGENCCPDILPPLLLPAIEPSFDIRSIAELRRIIIVLV